MDEDNNGEINAEEFVSGDLGVRGEMGSNREVISFGSAILVKGWTKNTRKVTVYLKPTLSEVV